MKQYIANLVLVCVFAISFHGLGTNEHVISGFDETANVQAGQYVDVLDDTSDESGTRMTAACDICQVVHQYLLGEPLQAHDRLFAVRELPVFVGIPPDQAGSDISHPPMV